MLHPPTEFEPCTPYCFWEEAQANKHTNRELRIIIGPIDIDELDTQFIIG